MSRWWRSFGGTRFELSADNRLAGLARQWLGSDGWRKRRAPAGAIGIEVTAIGSQLLATAPALGPPLRGTLEEVFGELEIRSLLAALARCRRRAAIHAALVATPQASLLLVGGHQAGKTTLALALAERGLALHGDDVVLVGGDGGVVGLPRPLRVRPPTIGLLPSLGPRIRANAVHDRHQGIFRTDLAVIGRTPRRPPPVAAIVFASYRPRAPLSLRSISSDRAAARLLDQLFKTPRAITEQARAALALLSHAVAWQLDYGGRPARAADLLMSRGLS